MDRLEAFLRANLGAHPEDLVEHAASSLRIEKAEIERAANRLIELGDLEKRQHAGRQVWSWRPVFQARLEPGMAEDRIWIQAVLPRLGEAPENVRRILGYGTTEMLNNVLDHSGASRVVVFVKRLENEFEVQIEDDGIGIFRKLQRDKGLEDPQHVALELAKGKLTTDPSHHTGQGIFFTARMCDKFLIWSDSTACGQTGQGSWQVREAEPRPGTTVRMTVDRNTRITPKAVFDEFFPRGADDIFAKTIVQVALVQQNGMGLVSRSQAKRLLARCDEFREVVLDFDRVESIGPAFADEIFRVFVQSHPAVAVREIHSSAEVARMIAVARKSAGQAPA